MEVPRNERIGNEIVIRLRTIAQLFHSLDPSPFRDRDLDQNAAQFIVESALELPAGVEPRLVICLPSAEARQAGEVPDAVRHYFSVLGESEKSELRELVSDGRKGLVIGVVLVVVVVSVVEAAREFATERGTIAEGLLESLTIVAWVILWRPVEILLYDRLPRRRRMRLYERLARMPIAIQPHAEPLFPEHAI